MSIYAISMFARCNRMHDSICVLLYNVAGSAEMRSHRYISLTRLLSKPTSCKARGKNYGRQSMVVTVRVVVIRIVILYAEREVRMGT